MTTDRTLVTRLLVRTAAQLEQLRREHHLKQYQVGYGKVSPSTAHNVLKGKDHRIGTLVDIADSMDCDVVITIVKRSA